MNAHSIPGELLGEVLISKQKIIEREHTMADLIIKDNLDTNPIFLCVKQGAKYFFDDLCKILENKELIFDKAWISISSYERNASSGKVNVGEYSGPNLEGRKVIIVEDIIDTALTLKKLIRYLESEGVSEQDVCALLFKKRPENLFWRILGLRSCFGLPRIRYLGAFIPNYFVVGKGLDYADYGRTEEAVHILPPEGQAWVDEQLKDVTI